MRALASLLFVMLLVFLCPFLCLYQWIRAAVKSGSRNESPSLLFFLRVFYPNEQANAVQLTQLCRNLQGAVKIEVVCNTSMKGTLPEDLSNVTVHRFPLPSFLNQPATWLSSSLSFLIAFFSFPKNYIFILWTDPPFLDSWMGTLCKICGYRYIVWLQDWYPRNLMGMGLLRHRTISSSLLSWQRWVHRSAEKVICISSDAEKILRADGVKNTLVIQNSAPVSAEVQPKPRSEWWGGKSQKALTLMFAGNFGLSFDVDLMRKIAEGIPTQKHFLFVFHGNGRNFQPLSRLLSSHPSVVFSGWVSKAGLPELNVQCDAHLVMLRDCLTGTTFPSKIYSIMAAGKPVVAIAPRQSMLYSMVQDIGCGVAADANSALDVLNTLQKLEELFRTNPEELAKMGANGRRYVETQWNDKIAAETLRNHLLPHPAPLKELSSRRR